MAETQERSETIAAYQHFFDSAPGWIIETHRTADGARVTNYISPELHRERIDREVLLTTIERRRHPR